MRAFQPDMFLPLISGNVGEPSHIATGGSEKGCDQRKTVVCMSENAIVRVKSMRGATGIAGPDNRSPGQISKLIQIMMANLFMLQRKEMYKAIAFLLFSFLIAPHAPL